MPFRGVKERMDNNNIISTRRDGIDDVRRTSVPSNKLPPLCFAVDPQNGDLIEIVKGTDGYYIMCVQLKTKELNQRKANKLNADLGVTKRQVAAMLYGALFGWKSPKADPKQYTVSGAPFVNSFQK